MTVLMHEFAGTVGLLWKVKRELTFCSDGRLQAVRPVAASRRGGKLSGCGPGDGSTAPATKLPGKG